MASLSEQRQNLVNLLKEIRMSGSEVATFARDGSVMISNDRGTRGMRVNAEAYMDMMLQERREIGQALNNASRSLAESRLDMPPEELGRLAAVREDALIRGGTAEHRLMQAI